MLKKNDFEVMCDKLEKCTKCDGKNEIICARKYVKEYVTDDLDKLLKLKAEAEGINHNQFLALLISISAFLISACNFANGLFGEYKVYSGIFNAIAVAVFLFYIRKEIVQFSNVGKWQKYLIVVINELEDEMKK